MILSQNTDPLSVSNTVLGEAHSRNASIFGPSGCREYLCENSLSDFEPVYGNYAVVLRHGRRISIKTDHFGLFKIYTYRHGDFWAISDSIHELVELARESGKPLTPYAPAAYGFFLRGGMGQQLGTYRTPIAEIRLIPHWQNIAVDDGKLNYEKKPDVVYFSGLHEAIIHAGLFFASLLKSYLDSGIEPIIRMSAGLDSRGTLAGMLAVNDSSLLNSVGLYTSGEAQFTHEKAIVLSLLDKTPLHLREKSSSKRGESWAGWKRRFLGGQAHIATYPAYGLPHPNFTGSSGELARHFYDWDGSVESLGFFTEVPSGAKSMLLADVERAVNSFDAQGKDMLTPANKHYHMFRNRYHFGRNSTESIFNFPPLVYAMLSQGTGRGNNEPLHRMIYELGGSALLHHPYDAESKGFNKPTPLEWKEVKFSNSDLEKRCLFRGHAGRKGSDGDHREAPPGDLNWKRGHLLSDAFISDASLAITRTAGRRLLDQRTLDAARKQLEKLKTSRDAALPGYYPALMAVMSLDMTSPL